MNLLQQIFWSRKRKNRYFMSSVSEYDTHPTVDIIIKGKRSVYYSYFTDGWIRETTYHNLPYTIVEDSYGCHRLDIDECNSIRL